jgi:hypothetical protein
MLIGLSTGTLLGVHASFLYLVIYLITMFTLLGILLSLKKVQIKIYLKQTHPIIKFILIIFFFQFFAKF